MVLSAHNEACCHSVRARSGARDANVIRPISAIRDIAFRRSRPVDRHIKPIAAFHRRVAVPIM